MKRQVLLLSIIAAVLVVVLFYLLAFQPKRVELAEVEERIAAEQSEQVRLEAELGRLRQVREGAPEVEAELAAAEAIVPREPAIPSALRQLQVASDESGVVLQTVSTSRPAPVDGGPQGLASISVNTQVLGSYFQVVDFLRRTEDPSITPRGIRWGSVNLSKQDYPTLTVTVSGEMFALLPVAPAEAEEPTDEADGLDGEVAAASEEEGQ
jgi:Tfp pilus assembly protein PilO